MSIKSQILKAINGPQECGCEDDCDNRDGTSVVPCRGPINYTPKDVKELVEATLNLVCCPAFNGKVFEGDKESHKAWTLARLALQPFERRQT